MLALSHQRECLSTKITSITGERLSRNRRIDLVVLEEKIFKFLYFIIISPDKRQWSFIWTNLNPLYWRMLCTKFGWNRPSGSCEEDFFNLDNVFSLFPYSPLRKGQGPSFEKLEIPSTKDILCQVWLKLAKWLWRIRWKCEKFTTPPTMMTTTMIDNGQILIRKAHLSLRLRWAKKFTDGQTDLLALSLFSSEAGSLITLALSLPHSLFLSKYE